jgi:hypothetical protein
MAVQILKQYGICALKRYTTMWLTGLWPDTNYQELRGVYGILILMLLFVGYIFLKTNLEFILIE